jgi:hypothetical protein
LKDLLSGIGSARVKNKMRMKTKMKKMRKMKMRRVIGLKVTLFPVVER